jgi:hypothetical protein
MLSAYRGALKSDRFHNPSDQALAECLTFRYNKAGKVESMKSSLDPGDDIARIPHGDRAIADALLWDCFLRCPAMKEQRRDMPAGSPAARMEAKRKAAARRGRYAF